MSFHLTYTVENRLVVHTLQSSAIAVGGYIILNVGWMTNECKIKL